jgi:hypothetical protein
MLVTVSSGEIVSSRKQPKGLIVSVAPNGKIDPKPLVTGLTTPLGLDVAPPGFGDFAGQIFVSDAGDIQVPVPQTQQLKRDGKLYRVTREGELKLVASGFVSPAGVHFIGHHLWVTDINGDFIAGDASYRMVFWCRSTPDRCRLNASWNGTSVRQDSSPSKRGGLVWCKVPHYVTGPRGIARRRQGYLLLSISEPTPPTRQQS